MSWRAVELDDLGPPDLRARPRRRVARRSTLQQSGAHQVANARGRGRWRSPSACRSQRPWRRCPTRRARLALADGAARAGRRDCSSSTTPTTPTPPRWLAALDTLAEIGRAARTTHGRGAGRDEGARSRATRSRTGRSGGPPRRPASTSSWSWARRPRGIAEGARSPPTWSGDVILTARRDEALDWVRQNVAAEDVVLVKASRGVALEGRGRASCSEGGTGAP